MGASRAGFSHSAVIERDEHAYNTLLSNKMAGVSPISQWPIFKDDVSKFDYSSFKNVDLLAGGPPCQPFSQAGKRLGGKDERDMFPEAARAVRALRPPFFVFENVKGLVRPSFWDYSDYVQLQLEHLSMQRLKGESWEQHHLRLRQHHLSRRSTTDYRVILLHVNAADFGVPQNRHRVFFVGVRSDISANITLPVATHSCEGLLRSKWVTGEYWDRHGISKKGATGKPRDIKVIKAKCENSLDTAPWLTVRDAISDLLKPATSPANACFNGHVLIPGARSYHGHTGSVLDEPAKALKAGVHGVPGGENMIRFSNGRIRYFTLRECARLQCFPDEFLLDLPWTRTMGALGNAVPVILASAIIEPLYHVLSRS